MIQIKEAGYSYQNGFVLEPVSFDIPDGSFSVFLGPNGSGKSTLFSLINGTKLSSYGEILINGQSVKTIENKKRARLIGLVPQIHKTPFEYTVKEIVSMGRFPYRGFFSGESRKDREVIEKVLNRLNLGKYINRSIQELSGGEYQRVLIARALVQDTRILLLDEPGNHLDLKHQLMLLGILKEETSNGKTVIAVLHDLNQAIHYADNCLLLDNGKTIRKGNPSKVLSTDIIGKIFETKLSEYKDSSGRVMLGP
ncbi:MAG: ABC transporter ATP-binding protein [Spirochaetales bacterium]|nr:ABC transporter ATP-binding protein [Spirochaetales bacterium]